MSSTNIGQLAARITADATDFMRTTAAVKKEAASLKATLDSALGGLGGIAKGAASFAGIPLDAKSAWSAFKDEIGEVTSLGKEAAKSGLGLDTFIGLKAMGHDTDSMLSSLARFRKELGSVHDEASDLKSPFADLGLSGLDLKKLSEDQALGKTFDALNRVGNEFTKAKTSSDLFGRSYQDMTRAISGGSAGLGKATQYAKDFGLGFSKEDLQNAKDVKAALRDIDNAFAGIRRQAALAFAPLVADLAQGLGGILKGVNLRDVFDKAAREFALAGADILDVIGDIKKGFKDLNAETEDFIAIIRFARKLGKGMMGEGFNAFAPDISRTKGGGTVEGAAQRWRAFGQGAPREDTWGAFAGMRDLAKPTGADDDLVAIGKSARIYTSDLRNQVDAMKLAQKSGIDLGDATKLLEFKNMGADAATMKLIASAQKEANIFKDAGKWIDAAVGPVEQFTKEIDRLNTAFEAGALGEGAAGWNVYAAAANKAGDAILRTSQIGETKLPSIATAGSKEAFEIIARSEGGVGGRGGVEAIVEAIKSQREIDKRNEQNTKAVADWTRTVRISDLSK